MKIVSLFAGIGGLEMGLSAAIPGAHVVAQVEIDPHCQRVSGCEPPRHQPMQDLCMDRISRHFLGKQSHSSIYGEGVL